MRVQDVYKKMDSTLEGFFYKRQYNLFNFNFLLQVLSEKKQYDESLKILDKMKVPSKKFLNILLDNQKF